MYTITVKDACKDFREVHALDHATCTFGSGNIHGLVGRNGSGKTMLLKCICGLSGLTSGSIEVDGIQIRPEKRLPVPMGIIIENPGFLPHMSGLENLKLLASIRRQIDVEQIRETMRTVGLDPGLRRAVGKYSLGMRQRLGIAQAIMEDPPVLLLDEPFNGLDNKGVEEMRTLLQKLKRNEKTIVIASHNPLDIEVLCDAVYEMDSGVMRCVKAVETSVAGETYEDAFEKVSDKWKRMHAPVSFERHLAGMVQQLIQEDGVKEIH